MAFMTAVSATFDGIECHISRSGYTGEDGYEIYCQIGPSPGDRRTPVGGPRCQARWLGGPGFVAAGGRFVPLWPRPRREHLPVEARLAFSIGRRRREQNGFPGASRILAELQHGPPRVRVGFEVEGRVPAREGTAVLNAAGQTIGKITSGGYSPTLGRPIAMGYVGSEYATPGTAVVLLVRKSRLPATVRPLPFVAHRYYRKS